MRQVLPESVDDVDVADLYASDARPAPDGRPWVLVNMIATADGATTVGGVSGPLGGPEDKVVFGAIRGVADVIVAGAATVRAESYGPPRPSESQRRRRVARGQTPVPRLAVVTASGDLDPGLRLFAEAGDDERPIVVTCEACPPDRRAALEPVAEIIVAGDLQVDLGRALGELHRRGARVVLAEGGPSLNGQLIAADLVDEWCLSLAPVLASGSSARPAHGPERPDGPVPLRLDRLLESGGVCFFRYVRA